PARSDRLRSGHALSGRVRAAARDPERRSPEGRPGDPPLDARPRGGHRAGIRAGGGRLRREALQRARARGSHSKAAPAEDGVMRLLLLASIIAIAAVFVTLAAAIVASKAWREIRDRRRGRRRRALEPAILAFAHGNERSILPALGGGVARKDRHVVEQI